MKTQAKIDFIQKKKTTFKGLFSAREFISNERLKGHTIESD